MGGRKKEKDERRTTFSGCKVLIVMHAHTSSNVAGTQILHICFDMGFHIEL